MEEKKFTTGDVVELKSGGCAMTVHSTDTVGNVLCNWHNEKGEAQGVYYMPGQLVLQS
jgi:uncharacterized protein YodC (DUF2158 family)